MLAGQEPPEGFKVEIDSYLVKKILEFAIEFKNECLIPEIDLKPSDTNSFVLDVTFCGRSYSWRNYHLVITGSKLTFWDLGSAHCSEEDCSQPVVLTIIGGPVVPE